ncbi:hypothetical protein [Lactobacillus kimbladii]|uniref:hypothetical protein n=1 Tax=Lactobacillus kimbladii TaxID=1218506 RepID=UPI000A75FB35
MNKRVTTFTNDCACINAYNLLKSFCYALVTKKLQAIKKVNCAKEDVDRQRPNYINF